MSFFIATFNLFFAYESNKTQKNFLFVKLFKKGFIKVAQSNRTPSNSKKELEYID